MKKILSVILAAALTVSLTACGSEQQENAGSTAENTPVLG